MPEPVKPSVRSAGSIETHAEKARKGVTLMSESKEQQGSPVSDPSLDSSVTTHLQFKRNMGDYESLQVGVSITSPCRNDEDHKKEVAAEDVSIGMQIIEHEFVTLQTAWFPPVG